MSTGNIADRIVDDYSGFKVYDERGEKLGKVEYTILDDREQPQYLGVKTGFFGTKTTLIPEELVRLSDSDQEFNVETSDNHVKDAPTFDSNDEITSDYESRIREHYGLGSSGASSGSSTMDEQDSNDSRDRDSYDNRDARSDRNYDDRGDRDDRDMRSSSSGEGSFDRESGSSESSSRDDLADRRSDRDSDRDSGSGGGAAAGAAGAAGGAAAASSMGRERDERNDRDTEVRNTSDIERGNRDSDSSSRQGSDNDKEQIRVTLKREKARAERVVDEDGEEEVRIRKRTVKEESLVDVEDVEGERR